MLFCGDRQQNDKRTYLFTDHVIDHLNGLVLPLAGFGGVLSPRDLVLNVVVAIIIVLPRLLQADVEVHLFAAIRFHEGKIQLQSKIVAMFNFQRELLLSKEEHQGSQSHTGHKSLLLFRTSKGRGCLSLCAWGVAVWEGVGWGCSL